MFKWIDDVIKTIPDWLLMIMLFISVFTVMWSYTTIFLEVVG